MIVTQLPITLYFCLSFLSAGKVNRGHACTDMAKRGTIRFIESLQNPDADHQ